LKPAYVAAAAVALIGLALLAFAIRTRARMAATRAGGAGLFLGIAGLGLFCLAFAGGVVLMGRNSGFADLMDAIDRGDEAVVRALLSRDPELVSQTSYARHGSGVVNFPLLHAARRHQPAMGRILVEQGAPVNQKTATDQTALHWAADRDTSLMELLLAKGAPVDARTREGQTPLHYAASTRHAAPTELLLSRGADVNARDGQGASPLHLADSAEVASVLCAHGADEGARDAQGATASDRAAANEDPVLAAWLGAQGPCAWLRAQHARGVSVSTEDRQAAVHEYYCEQMKAEPVDPSRPQRRPSQAASCFSLGRALEKGVGREPDTLRALAAYTLACDNGHAGACNQLGVLYAKGRGVPRDEARAVAFYRRACDGGSDVGCRNVARH
jgi:TPR repeat protein